MSETILTWNAPNMITVTLMYFTVLFFIGLLLLLVNKARSNSEAE